MNSIIRFSPTFGSLRREIDRLFDNLSSSEEAEAMTMWSPQADMTATDQHYLIRMDVPGLSRDELSIELRDDMLVISGERKTEHEVKNENVHRVERRYGRFYRSFPLPHAANAEGVSAQLKDGVLRVEVPKREESRPRKISVE